MDLLYALALTQHIGFSETYNEIHPHVRMVEDNAIMGIYYNSIENISVYAGVRYENSYDFGVELALVTGYDIPLAPYTRITYKNAFLTPAMDNGEFGWVLGYEFFLDTK